LCVCWVIVLGALIKVYGAAYWNPELGGAGLSYLDSPRLHFNGWFQADVSTINNDVTAFDTGPSAGPPDPGWNPEGTGIFRLIDCSVTGGFFNGRPLSAGDDSVIGMTIQNADERPPGKLVDLDPQQQMVSMIFGMQVRLVSSSLRTMLRGAFKPAPFTNLWQRQITGLRTDQKLGAMYQSVLEDVSWPGEPQSPLVRALRDATQGKKLSIEFAVYGYGRDPKIPRYTMGRVAGTIGRWRIGEPDHFVMGRQMIAPGPPFGTPPGRVATLQAKVDQDRRSITIDFGNSFQVETADSGPVDIGKVLIGVLTTNPDAVQKKVAESGIAIIGEVPYRNTNWYAQTAGVETFDLSGNIAAVKYLSDRPLVVVSPSAAPDSGYDVRLQESIEGDYVRADQFVFRIDPGETQTVDFYATRFGAPLADAGIALSNAGSFLANLGGTPPDLSVPPNAVNVPPASGPPVVITTDAHGHAAFSLKANQDGPTLNGNAWPRGYLAGQLYALGYQLEKQPASYVSNTGNFVSILAYSRRRNPDNVAPTWYDDIQPLFAQYGKLYPIMSKYVVDLSDYASVVTRLSVLSLAFSLPQDDPNHMPVTRDLGLADRQMILRWLATKGADGLPPSGTPRPAPLAAAPRAGARAAGVDLDPLQKAGKTAVIMKYEKVSGKGSKE
jgi:hypothetical protein